ncbi:MAG TPA: hypothetical protein VN634_15820 [Candidatus Limnocylindrales bacterium]|nr:hypothetical protein [Candidatus Limnocylindrales bacterium]
MTKREGSWWSRMWSAIALGAFAVHLGATVYEDAVVAPLWLADPPSSVAAWNALAIRPDAQAMFQALVAIVVVATTMSWLSGISVRGWRRWWLTLSLASAVALAVVHVLLIAPSERWLFGASHEAARAGDAAVVAWCGDWLRASAMRLAALVVGAWSSYRAQATIPTVATELSFAADDFPDASAAPAARGRRVRDFVFGDEPGPEIRFGDEPENPRQRWRASLPGHRRTAKK